MKRLLALILTLSMMLALCACGAAVDYAALSTNKLESLCAKGDTEAMLQLGERYAFDDNMIDYGKAMEYFLAAADAGSIDAMNNIGWLYESGTGVEKNRQTADMWYGRAREQHRASGELDWDILDWDALYAGVLDETELTRYIEFFTEQAEQGDTGAMVTLGNIYEYGEFGICDFEQAREWYTKAYDAGSIDAAWALYDFYRYSYNVLPDGIDLADFLRTAADAGDFEAMLRLGSAYKAYHISIPQAMEYLTSAYDAGVEGAACALGDLYADMSDGSTALEWYAKGADAGDGHAALSAGYIYLNGKHKVRRDYAAAREWFERAAALGDSRGYLYVGDLYYDGKGVSVDMTKWEEYYEKAYSAGDTSNLWIYAFGLDAVGKFDRAILLFNKMIELGDYDGANMMGIMCIVGHGVPRDYKKMEEYFLLGAEHGNGNCMYNLAEEYLSGKHIQRDGEKAAYWFEMTGSTEHLFDAANIYYTGNGVEPDYAKAADLYRRAADNGYAPAKEKLAEMRTAGLIPAN